jgi:hypothetical protein
MRQLPDALRAAAALLYTRWADALDGDPDGERGTSAEQVIITAVLVTVALTVVGIISAQVIGYANDRINLGP